MLARWLKRLPSVGILRKVRETLDWSPALDASLETRSQWATSNWNRSDEFDSRRPLDRKRAMTATVLPEPTLDVLGHSGVNPAIFSF